MGLGNASLRMRCILETAPRDQNDASALKKKNRNREGNRFLKTRKCRDSLEAKRHESVLRLFGIQNVSLWLLRFCRLEHWLPEYRFDYIMHYTHRRSRICKSSRWRVLPCPYPAQPGFSTPPGCFSFMHVHETSELYIRNSDATELKFKSTNYFQFNWTVNTYR